ncbi:MAG: T9SS type A sorting domain-containing protein, partial [candidate division Zixibacteria bacterium]|nr:T9SS type A sorting domain-containing protein [candidate division Zixibacteria bacterium]
GGENPIIPQVDGLAFTLYMKLLPGVTAHCVDIDSTYIPPAGPFIFAPVAGGKIMPAYVDCGTADIIIGGTTCPSSNTAPVVADIPNQTIAEGGAFATINLDNYVADTESADNLITWTATSANPNNFSVNINAATRVATISFPGGEFSGSALFTFTATDPGALSASDTARFTVTPVNDPPVVAGIPDQILAYGATFATINLDNYVTDPDNTDAEMTWSYSGNSQLTVAISGARVATITKPSADWNGSESIIFTATDPGLLSDSDTATFSIAAPTPLIEITPDTLTFTAYAGGSDPAGQGAMITNTGNGTLDWNASEATTWLSLSSTSGTAPSGFTANIDVAGLAPGSYLADVTVTSEQASNSPQVLKAILHINNPVDIKLTPDSLSFYARKGEANPPSKNVGITNAIPSGVEFNWGAVETSPWLSMSATTGTSPSTVSFSVDITDLAVGTYNTLVEIKQVSLKAGVIDDIDTIYIKLLVDQPTGVDDDNSAVPKSYSLKQNYPNPFNPETVIEYNLAASGHVTLAVFNVLGQKVVDVVNGYESAGNKQAVWNGRDENGREVQSGVYFYRLTTDNFSMTRKMMLLK